MPAKSSVRTRRQIMSFSGGPSDVAPSDQQARTRRSLERSRAPPPPPPGARGSLRNEASISSFVATRVATCPAARNFCQGPEQRKAPGRVQRTSSEAEEMPQVQESFSSSRRTHAEDDPQRIARMAGPTKNGSRPARHRRIARDPGDGVGVGAQPVRRGKEASGWPGTLVP